MNPFLPVLEGRAPSRPQDLQGPDDTEIVPPCRYDKKSRPDGRLLQLELTRRLNHFATVVICISKLSSADAEWAAKYTAAHRCYFASAKSSSTPRGWHAGQEHADTGNAQQTDGGRFPGLKSAHSNNRDADADWLLQLS